MASELAGVKEELSNLLRDNPGRAGEDLVFGRTSRLINAAVFRQFQKETGIDVSHITGVTAEDVAEIVGRPTAGEYEIVEEN